MPVPVAASQAQNEGAWRFSGLYGAAYRDGRLLMEVTDVAGTLAIARVDVPLVGRTRNGHKRGRETRDGTLTIQKIDSSWEYEIWKSLTAGLDERRDARDAGTPLLTTFNLEVWYDDPDALGKEGWRLNGVQLWDVPMGFSAGDDIVNRQFTMTWETEEPLQVFTAEVSSTGVPAAIYYEGYGA
jgi:hypothetical protein